MPRDDERDGPGPLASTLAGAGERVVLVHGFTQTGASWRTVAAALRAHHEVCAIDLPGHGRSGEIAADDLAGAARLLGETGGKASYVGYSLGGRTCLTLALDAPRLVERLVLVGATPGIADPAERAERRAADDALAARLEGDARAPGGLDAFLDEWLAGPLFANLSPEQADRAARAGNAPARLAGALRALGTGAQPPSWDRLCTLKMPVLVCAGERDEKFRAIGAAMVGAIGGNARLALVPGAGHAAPFEVPAAFGALVADFLAEPVS